MTDPGLIDYQHADPPDWWERQFVDGGWPDDDEPADCCDAWTEEDR